MKILWHSGAPWAPTGYGQQTAIFTPRIRDLGHEMMISNWWGGTGSTLEYEGIRVLPSDQKYGNITLPAYVDRYKPDVVIALMDAWVLNPAQMRDLPLAVWVPVDHKPCPPRVAEFFKQTGSTPIAMSRFGEQMLQESGLNPLYVPHGIDTTTFRPDNREAVREAAGVADRFVVGMVANNSGGMPPAGGPPRKAFPEAFMAFATFRQKHPDALLYLHAELTGKPGIENGINLGRLLDRFEIPPEAVKLTDQLSYELGIPPPDMANLYSAFDVLLNPSYGEGFGIPIVEAQACGTPVIVTDWTAMTELCGAGWLIDGEPWYDCHHEAFFLHPYVRQIVVALEEAYTEASGLRDQARDFAVQYDADLLTSSYWEPVLEQLGKPREVPPLNREMRRRKARAAV